MIDAVIFDVDGTLVDSVVHEIVAWHEAFVRNNFDVTRDAVRQQMGKGADHLLPTLLPQESKRTHDRIAEAQGKIFRAQHRPDVRAFAMSAPLMTRLREAGVKIAIGSSGDKEDIEHYLRLTRATDLVDVLVCMDDVERSKPDPDIFQLALKRLGGPNTQRVLAIGDTIYDVQAATAVGIRTIGVLGGAFGMATMRKAGCIAVYHDVAELFARLSASPLRLDDADLGADARLAAVLTRG
ncbi:HAD family hydrolase [Roseiterribacter gracilis]|uniref:Phosphoglycolate phosphatase n=1 Tax=Roseiterribacter gracilis TaxID=2812848 RepID=A0A8S8X7L5_9PROT|nr:phosphoglycolate phosphatase [Rhodospirillales bacterium TMPK1]